MAPPDLVGAWIPYSYRGVRMTPDGRAWVYGFWQFLHDLYVTEGLK